MQKKQVLQNLKENKACVVVGTHALLSVECDLALVIIDEEHNLE